MRQNGRGRQYNNNMYNIQLWYYKLIIVTRKKSSRFIVSFADD